MYTDNGFWDTFRSQFPLTNILHPTLQGRYMNALLAAQEQCGWLPSWSSPGETGGMLAITLSHCWQMHGLKAFAFRSGKSVGGIRSRSNEQRSLGRCQRTWILERIFPTRICTLSATMGSSAQTMEYAYDDFCGYQLLK